MSYYEIPLAIQDRSFNSNGALFYPASRSFFDGFAGPYAPFSDIAPIWNPEFFGNTMVVNGRTWPVLKVEARRYRLRILNGCNSRFLVLKLVAQPLAARPVPARLNFTQVGSDGGFLPAPVDRIRILLGPAERADVVVDFSKLPAGTQLYMINEGPDEPFGGGDVDNGNFAAADPMTTGQLMKFVVGKVKGRDTTLPPAQISWPYVAPAFATSTVRKVALLEEDSEMLTDVGPRAALLGTVNNFGVPTARMWADPVTETIKLNRTETWEIYNFTADAHPIHLHQTMFQVVGRQALLTDADGIAVTPAQLSGPVFPADAAETGFKDTVIALPGQVTRFNARFDLLGRFVWHCHILEHEDNEMMRPMQVVP
jgi:bilirubin oxidase